jgi:hypothetical protein
VLALLAGGMKGVKADETWCLFMILVDDYLDRRERRSGYWKAIVFV